MRYYGEWAGNPKGVKEDPSHCVVEVASYPSYLFAQCRYKRKYGDLCGRHKRLKDKGQKLCIPEEV